MFPSLRSPRTIIHHSSFKDQVSANSVQRQLRDLSDNINLASQTFGEQGWRSEEGARFPPMWPWFDSRTLRRHMWVEFVIGSFPCSERFFSISPGTTVFLASYADNEPKECLRRRLRFSLLLKNQHFPIPIRSWNATDVFERVVANSSVLRG